jgi:hypothetical protein
MAPEFGPKGGAGAGSGNPDATWGGSGGSTRGNGEPGGTAERLGAACAQTALDHATNPINMTTAGHTIRRVAIRSGFPCITFHKCTKFRAQWGRLAHGGEPAFRVTYCPPTSSIYPKQGDRKRNVNRLQSYRN